jgi:hypothetical protein
MIKENKQLSDLGMDPPHHSLHQLINTALLVVFTWLGFIGVFVTGNPPPPKWPSQESHWTEIWSVSCSCLMFTPARDFLLETPWRIIFPNPNVDSHSL